MKDLRFFWREFFSPTNRPKQVRHRRNVSPRELFFVFASLCLTYSLWYFFYRMGPLAAYSELASAFESGDLAQVQRLGSSSDGFYTPAQIKEITRPFGGMRAFGKAMRRAPQVDILTHTVIAVDNPLNGRSYTHVVAICLGTASLETKSLASLLHRSRLLRDC